MVVFLTTLFALWKGVSDGSTAIVIVQSGIFAEASRQLVKYVFFGTQPVDVITHLAPGFSLKLNLISTRSSV